VSEDDRLRAWLRRPVLEVEPEAARVPGEDPIFEQLDALQDERRERGDSKWFPSGPDPRGLERLVEERKKR
jgi:hypothetical protein